MVTILMPEVIHASGRNMLARQPDIHSTIQQLQPKVKLFECILSRCNSLIKLLDRLFKIVLDIHA